MTLAEAAQRSRWVRRRGEPTYRLLWNEPSPGIMGPSLSHKFMVTLSFSDLIATDWEITGADDEGTDDSSLRFSLIELE